eukprot:scaffold336_cov250-Pinguiococcus_pyrenoidosus.AAC.18
MPEWGPTWTNHLCGDRALGRERQRRNGTGPSGFYRGVERNPTTSKVWSSTWDRLASKKPGQPRTRQHVL